MLAVFEWVHCICEGIKMHSAFRNWFGWWSCVPVYLCVLFTCILGQWFPNFPYYDTDHKFYLVYTTGLCNRNFREHKKYKKISEVWKSRKAISEQKSFDNFSGDNCGFQIWFWPYCHRKFHGHKIPLYGSIVKPV